MRRTGIGILAAIVSLACPAAAHSSCVLFSQDDKRNRADVIFVGEFLEGPTESGVQRFEVERYEKGAGGDVVHVATGVVARPDGTGSLTSVSIEAKAGERWRIYAMKRGGRLETNECDGSTRLASVEPPARSDARSSDSGATKWSLIAALAFAGSALALLLLRRWYRGPKIAPAD